MLSFVARRLLVSIVLLVGVTFFTFLISRVLPSEPVMVYVGRFATREQIEKARKDLGFDRPWYVQYMYYFANLVTGKWGISLRTHRPVLVELAERLPASLELIFVGMLLGISTGLALGLLAAAFPRSWIDSLARIAATAGVAMPQFWFAMILQLVFGRVVKVLPIIGRLDMWIRYQPATNFLFVDSLITRNGELLKSALLHIILPAICVATYPTAMCTRLLRAKMLDIVNQEYIRTARAFGVSEKKIFTTYALKNALGPIIIMTALSFVFTLIGTFLVETIFAWPGIGSYAAESIISNDVPVIFSIVSITAICTLLLNLGAEIIIASLDPRIRFE